ncbi:MAG: NAD(P)H-hydrate dehydratase [Fulvimonas sp.]|nr:NAD(P)H-hydrate dehydratase [Fulvimonas sp.]
MQIDRADLDLYTVEQARMLDRRASEAFGMPGYTLMRRAASAAFAALLGRWPQARRLLVCCGPGNNGGDGYQLAALACDRGLEVTLIELAAPASGDAGRARAACVEAGLTPVRWQLGMSLPEVEVIVDALFGTGLKRALEGEAAALVQALAAHGAPVLALDVPSGVNADTGEVPGPAVRAALTVTFIVAKRGLYTGAAPAHTGPVWLDDLALPAALREALAPDARLLASAGLPPRARDAHKGDNGHVLAVGGEHGTAGAIRLCGEAALRCGAGLVSVATRGAHLSALNAARPELMAHAVEGLSELGPLLARATTLAVGPGLGQGAWGHALWLTALDSGKPLVLDADGLNLLARAPRRFTQPAVLTPHPGEAARLLGGDVAEVQADRFAAARALAARYQAVVVLKGAGSLIAAPDGRLAVCPWGNPGMASGGMGDLLTGVIAALLAQHLTPWQAACLGVGLHARAGDLAAAEAGERGLIASDLLLPLRRLLNGTPST